jgi:hypothetical protein
MPYESLSGFHSAPKRKSKGLTWENTGTPSIIMKTAIASSTNKEIEPQI